MNSRLMGSGWVRPLVSILVGLALAGIIMWLSGYSVRDAYSALWTGATGLEAGRAQSANQLGLGPLPYHINKFLLAQSLAKTTPLLFTGLAIALGLRAGLFNIGAQGQMIAGALAAAVMGTGAAAGGAASHTSAIPASMHIVLVIAAGMAAGALWGGMAGLLKATRGVHEVLSTIMLNYVAIDVATYLATHGLKDPTDQAPQTALISPTAQLSPLIPGSNLTIGIVFALMTAVAFTLLMRRTAPGFEIRAVGLGADAARAAGIPVERTIITTLALSGALAGLAGAVEVMGVQHRYIQGIAANYGFDGIAVALLGGLSGPGVVLSALFFGALSSGATYMRLQTNVPDSITVIVQALVILFVGIRLLRRPKPTPAASSVEEFGSEPMAEHAPL